MRTCLLISLLACLLSPLAVARDDVAAAVVLREADVGLVFEDGTRTEIMFGRYGVEYWEPVARHVWMGFSIGYSENDSRDGVRPAESIDGAFGGLGLRFDVPATDWLSLAGEANVLFQRDRHTVAPFEFESRLREVRAEFGPRAEFGRLTFALGAAWRELDYRETIAGDGVADAAETVRHADAADRSGGFAALGLRTDNDGHIALRYDAGYETGWTLRYERTF